MAKDISADDISEFLESNDKAILYFWSELCGPCHIMGPQLEDAANDKGIEMAKIDCDENEEASRDFSVKSLPTIVSYASGKEVSRLTGFHSKKDIQRFITESLGG